MYRVSAQGVDERMLTVHYYYYYYYYDDVIIIIIIRRNITWHWLCCCRKKNCTCRGYQQGHDGSVGGALDRKAKRNTDTGSSLRCGSLRCLQCRLSYGVQTAISAKIGQWKAIQTSTIWSLWQHSSFSEVNPPYNKQWRSTNPGKRMGWIQRKQTASVHQWQSCCWNRRDVTVVSRLHIGRPSLSRSSFLLKGDRRPLRIACCEFLRLEHIVTVRGSGGYENEERKIFPSMFSRNLFKNWYL